MKRFEKLKPFPNDKLQTLPNPNSLQTTFSNWMKMAESSQESVENALEKGEIARYKQFHLFPQCFQRLEMQTRKNQGLFGKGLNLSRAPYLGP